MYPFTHSHSRTVRGPRKVTQPLDLVLSLRTLVPHLPGGWDKRTLERTDIKPKLNLILQAVENHGTCLSKKVDWDFWPLRPQGSRELERGLWCLRRMLLTASESRLPTHPGGGL